MASFLDLDYNNVNLLQLYQKLKAGADTNEQNEFGQTPLMFASASCGPEVIDFFYRKKKL